MHLLLIYINTARLEMVEIGVKEFTGTPMCSRINPYEKEREADLGMGMSWW